LIFLLTSLKSRVERHLPVEDDPEVGAGADGRLELAEDSCRFKNVQRTIPKRLLYLHFD
jgi:hypothetical protein